MGYISHLDFQRLWQRLFRIAGIEVEKTQGYNPHPKLRFALPLPTCFESENELMEAFLVEDMPSQQLVAALNSIAPGGLEVLGATLVPQSYPKLTGLVDALAYRVELPEKATVGLSKSGDVETKGGRRSIEEYLLNAEVQDRIMFFKLKVDNQKTIRPDDLVKHFMPQLDMGGVRFIRTAIYTEKRGLDLLPQGLSILD